MVGTMAPVPQIADAVRTPVIAAGGIANARGIAAAFALGASGVQLGTAFLRCPETAVPPPYRARLDVSERRRYRGDPRLYRPGPRYTQSLCSRDGRCRGPRVSIASEHRRPALASARRPRPRRVDAGLGLQAASLMRELPVRELVDRLVRETQSVLVRST